MKCSVFAPSHITGFFEIIDHEEPLKRGSCGAGVAMDKGVITSLQIIDKDFTDSPNVDVRINGQKDVKNSSITFKTLELMERDLNISKILEDRAIMVDHEVEVPIGAGYGISAACALGTALGY